MLGLLCLINLSFWRAQRSIRARLLGLSAYIGQVLAVDPVTASHSPRFFPSKPSLII